MKIARPGRQLEIWAHDSHCRMVCGLTSLLRFPADSHVNDVIFIIWVLVLSPLKPLDILVKIVMLNGRWRCEQSLPLMVNRGVSVRMLVRGGGAKFDSILILANCMSRCSRNSPLCLTLECKCTPKSQVFNYPIIDIDILKNLHMF